jgi:eukaryotic-like serine/threonine-protein kinase
MEGIVEQVQDALGAQYRVEGVLARGGMTIVLRALDRKHDRVVAVKVLHPDLAGSVGVDRFLREIRLLARLQHPHILPLFDSGSAPGVLFYIMPFVDGETLRERLVRHGQLPIDETLRLGAQMCDALAYAHEHDIVHRDMKPENVLINGGHALLLDFGIARAIHVAAKTGTTGSGVVLGTPTYMSPEQASGEKFLDGRSDLYSLGCVLYEMLGGVPPHHRPTAREIITERMTSAPRPLSEHRRDIPPSLERAVLRSLARDREERFATAKEFAAALASVVAPAVPEVRPSPASSVPHLDSSGARQESR